MKLLCLKTHLPQPGYGAEISTLERLHVIKSWGWEVGFRVLLSESMRTQVYQYLEENNYTLSENVYFIEGIPCQLHFDPKFDHQKFNALYPTTLAFQKILNDEMPSVVWTNYYDYFATVAAVGWNSKKTWVSLTDNEFPRPWNLEYDKKMDGVSSVYRHITFTMVASKFMENVSRSDLPNAKPIYVPNPVNTSRSRQRLPLPQYFLFINPVKQKGVEFLLSLSRRMPQHKFAVVLNWNSSDLPKTIPENIEIHARQADLRLIMSGAKVLLVPSVWQEGFGRVVIEAMESKVPVLASDRGALPETVGSGGLSISLNLDRWVELLSQSDDFWNDFSEKAYARAAEYRKMTTKRFEQIKLLFEKASTGLTASDEHDL